MLVALVALDKPLVRCSQAQLLPAKPAQSIRHILDIYGLDTTFFDSFTPHTPLQPAEESLLWKLLMRLGEMRRLDLERWAKGDNRWQQFLEDPQQYRGDLCHVKGTLQAVEPVPLDEQVRDRFQLTRVLRVDIVTDSGNPATLYTSHVPAAWLDGSHMGAKVAAIAMLVKNAAPADQPPHLLMLTDRVAWFPDTLLGSLGMDVGLLDNVTQRAPLQPTEREAFFQLLAAVGRSKPGQLEVAAQKHLAELAARPTDGASTDEARAIARARDQLEDVVPLFNNPAAEVGQLVILEGDALRATEILVEDADIRERFGIRRYYEISMFTDDSQRNPLVCCVLHVPADFPLGDSISGKVRVAGFFFKSWAYPQGTLPGQSVTEGVRKQLAPMILGRELRGVVPVTSLVDYLLGGLLLAVLLAAIGGILVAALRSGRPRRAPLASPEPPDFSSLDA